ncbi:MAG TPA: hypothetical protein DIV86_01640 [Alphaproteobacteria bacterium]|nr:hypothetical protein [Alphaproteobacteria bacterium]
MPTPEQKQTYESIMKYFDVAENVVNVVEELGEDAAPFVPFVDGLLLKIEENAEIIAENFIKYTKSGNVLSGVEKLKIEKAQKNINDAIAEFMKLEKL